MADLKNVYDDLIIINLYLWPVAGTLEIGEYDQSDWGAPCEQCLFTFCKKTVMNIFIKGKNYEEIKYFGDGPNDLHPAQALSEKDKVGQI